MTTLLAALSPEDDPKSNRIDDNSSLFASPPIDKSFIRSCAFRENTEDLAEDQTEDLVRRHHENVFAVRAEGIRLQINRNEDLASMGRKRVLSEIAATDRELESTEQFIDAPAQLDGGDGEDTIPASLPWDAFSKVEFSLLGAMLIALLSVGAVTIANLLINSGYFPMFIERPFLAFLVTLIPISLSLVPKIVYETLESRRSRKFFKGCLLGLSALSGLTWLVYSSIIYSPDSSSEADMIANIMAGGTEASMSISLAPITILQILTELLIASLLFVRLKELWEKHSRLHRVPNSYWLQLRDSRVRSERELSNYGTVLRRSELEHQKLVNSMSAYVDDAIAFLRLVRETR